MNSIENLINEILLHLNKLINDLKITKDINNKIKEKIIRESRNIYLR